MCGLLFMRKKQEEIHFIILKIERCLSYSTAHKHVSFEVKQKWKTKEDTASFYLNNCAAFIQYLLFFRIVEAS